MKPSLRGGNKAKASGGYRFPPACPAPLGLAVARINEALHAARGVNLPDLFRPNTPDELDAIVYGLVLDMRGRLGRITEQMDARSLPRPDQAGPRRHAGARGRCGVDVPAGADNADLPHKLDPK